MKKLMLIAFVLVMYGCSKKSDVKPSAPSAPSIVGKWYATTLTYTDLTSTPAQVETTNYDHTDYYDFKEDGTGTQSFGGDVSPITYTTSNNILKVTSGANVQQITIKSMTANELILTQSFSDQGVTFETLELKFSR
jgi:hypothetical protein